MAKTEEDWFLRGGEKPAGSEKGRDVVELTVCQNCGGMNPAEKTRCMHCGASLTGGCPTGGYCVADGGYCVADGGNEEPETYIVTMSRTRSVQQTAKVRVEARSEEEAMDIAEGRAEDEAGSWSWNDVGYTEEYDDIEAIEAEEAG